MARVFVTPDSDPDVYYLVESSVGPHAANSRDDVLLVQFFLRVFSDREKRYRPQGAMDLVVNGAYSDVTGSYIKQFADENDKTPMYVNGTQVKRQLTVVESPIGNRAVAGGWLILQMNREYQRMFPKTGLPSSPQFPQELRKKFYV